MMRPDIEKTRAYYRTLGPENICSCDYCRNYCARAKAAYPEVAFYLASLGVDVERHFEILLPEPICYPIRLPFEEPESEDIQP